MENDTELSARARGERGDISFGKRIAIIGSVGIPNRYGGPEAFAENIAPALAERGFQVTVTCDRSRYTDDLSTNFKGVRRVFVPVGANGATSPLHDALAFLRVVGSSDYVLVLGVSAGMFFPLFRLLCAISGSRLLVNIDGVEWRRPKFRLLTKLVVYFSDWTAQRFTHVVIYDNDALHAFVRYPEKSVCVEYSGDHAVLSSTQCDAAGISAHPYALTICRIEPENNCEVLIQAFLRSSVPTYVFVGNWNRSTYGRTLRERYAGETRLRLLDPIYDPGELFRLRSSCDFYLHGHSVGGTNPSLVEVLFFDCRIFCWDCSFNRATAGDAVGFFSSVDDLTALLNDPPPRKADRSLVRRKYSTETIVRKLVSALNPGHVLQRSVNDGSDAEA